MSMKIAFISDIHSNIHALSAVIEEIEKENVDEIYCCGDIVGYNAFPGECIELVDKYVKASVRGNHDHATINGDTSWFNEYGVAGINYCRKVLSDEKIKFLESLPTHLHFNREGIKFYMVHGSPRNELFEYIFPSTSEETFEEFSISVDANVVVLGHTHIPMKRKIGETLFLNPGSVGQPRDGNPKASFVIFDCKNKEAVFRRVNYNIEEAKRAIIDKGLPLLLAERLDLGI